MRAPAVESRGHRTLGLVNHLGRIAFFVGEIFVCSVRPPLRFRRLVAAVLGLAASTVTS